MVRVGLVAFKQLLAPLRPRQRYWLLASFRPAFVHSGEAAYDVALDAVVVVLVFEACVRGGVEGVEGGVEFGEGAEGAVQLGQDDALSPR
jgi:hypothetical protein